MNGTTPVFEELVGPNLGPTWHLFAV